MRKKKLKNTKIYQVCMNKFSTIDIGNEESAMCTSSKNGNRAAGTSCLELPCRTEPDQTWEIDQKPEMEKGERDKEEEYYPIGSHMCF